MSVTNARTSIEPNNILISGATVETFSFNRLSLVIQPDKTAVVSARYSPDRLGSTGGSSVNLNAVHYYFTTGSVALGAFTGATLQLVTHASAAAPLAAVSILDSNSGFATTASTSNKGILVATSSAVVGTNANEIVWYASITFTAGATATTVTLDGVEFDYTIVTA